MCAGVEVPHLEELSATVHGQAIRGAIDGLDRTLTISADGVSEWETSAQARTRLGGAPWLLPLILDTHHLPILPHFTTSVLSIFVMDSPDQRVIEVKVNGANWPAARRTLVEAPGPSGSGMSLLRELAILSPEGPVPPLTRESVQRTLLGLQLPLEEDGAVRWMLEFPGWIQHEGRLGEPAAPAEVARLEKKVGRLPEDYRRFLVEVAKEGAGPGYGLLSPFHSAQEKVAQGEFDWTDGAEPLPSFYATFRRLSAKK